MDLTSPRRSSRNHASTLALDVAMSVTSSLADEMEDRDMLEEHPEKTTVEKKRGGPRSSSASSSTTSHKTRRTSTRKVVTTAAAAAAAAAKSEKRETRGGGGGATKRRAGTAPTMVDKRRRKRSETEEESEPEPEPEPKASAFSVARLIGSQPAGKERNTRLDLPDDDALPFPISVLFGNDALGKVDATQYPPNCTQFNIGGIKFLPLSCLMDDEGFTVPITQSVKYTKTDGTKHTASLAEALKDSGLTVKRRVVGKELLNVLRVAGLVVHWAFIAHLAPPLLRQLQQEREKARKTHESVVAQFKQLQQKSNGVGGSGSSAAAAAAAAAASGMASEEIVRKTVAELIQERKRRTGENKGAGGQVSPPLPVPAAAAATPAASSSSPALSSSTIFPVRDYRPRSIGLEALAKAAALRAGSSMTVAELMMQQMQLQQASEARRQSYDPPCSSSNQGAGGTPLKISDPDHLTKFIGLLNGEKEESPSRPATTNSFADFDHVPSLSIIQKILLIAEFDGGATEQQLADKYRIGVDKIPGILRLRVPLIREQHRMQSERRSKQLRMSGLSALATLPVRRTNFVGLNIMMWRFFKDCRDRGIALTGRQLKEHAMTIASQLGLSNFKGSEGWLDAFKRRHKIDLRTMTGEAVNYESDPDGNIICKAGDGFDDEDCSFDETTRSSSSPSGAGCGGLGDNLTEQLLASVTAIVKNQQESAAAGSAPGVSMLLANAAAAAIGGGSGTNGLAAFQPNFEDPRMAPDYRIDEASLITNIIRSTSVHVPNPEVAHALDVLRTYIVTHDPPAIGFFIDLQTRLAGSIGASQTIDALGEAGCSGAAGVGLLNGVGGMSDGADKTPPMLEGDGEEAAEEDGAAKMEEDEEAAEASGSTSKAKKSEEGADEKENEKKAEKSGEVAAAATAASGENGTANSSHDSTTSEDSNDD